MTGKIYGVGVGPGDPEMLTLKAVRIIKEADIICIPKADKEKCRAYMIAREAVPEIDKKQIIGFEFKMSSDRDAWSEMHREFYDQYKEYLAEGKKLAFLTIGDPAIYSTFGYIMKMAQADGFETEIVNGISSFCASAAAAGILLTENDEDIHIISGQGDIRDKLELPGTKIIMKSGRNISKIKKALKEYEDNRNSKIYAVSDCGTSDQKVYFGADEIPEDSGYMLTIMIK